MKKREIFIELTSLLDVILIMLFVLLGQAKFQTDEALQQAAGAESSIAQLRQELQSAEDVQLQLQNELAAAEGQKLELQQELDGYRRHEISIGVVEENSLVITLSVHADSGRYVLVESEGMEKVSVALDREDTNYAENKLRSCISNHVDNSGKETVFVVFQYDRGRIYQGEYQLVNSVVQELKAQAKAGEIALNYIETDIQTQIQ